MKKNYKPWVGDVESYPNFFCCTLLALNSDEFEVFVIDDEVNDRERLIKAFTDIYFLGYNNKTYDNLVINYIIKNPNVTAKAIFNFSDSIIKTQNRDQKEFFLSYGQYMRNDSYKYIDLMRMLFSKKLRVSLKELECSLNFKNVEELPYEIGSTLDSSMKKRVIEYNYNDCEATKMVAVKSLDAIKLRAWTNNNFGVDVFSLDGVNLGVKILEKKLIEAVGNSDFVKKNTNRKSVKLNDIIYPFIKFETPEFNAVLKSFRKFRCFKYFNEERKKEVWNTFKKDVLIGPYLFKYGIGGLHFETKTKCWFSDDEYSVLSVDVSSYYPRQVVEYPEYCKPEHLPDEFIPVYKGVMDERLKAKAEGDDIKSDTYKLSINGAFGNLSNEHSWLCDQKALMAITINGQLMLSMLCEKLMMHKITLIDVNTDGIYVHLHKSQRQIFDDICKEWSDATRMILEETKFESMFFLTTADYFGTVLKKGKIDVKEKGSFITVPRLGKGMEFPIIYKAVKEHFLNGVDFSKYIIEHDNILDFCSYKKLSRDSTCYWKKEKQQRVNRFYASRAGAHLYRTKWDEKRSRTKTDHILKDSPVMLLNKLDDKKINERSINYPFYLSKAREIIVALEGDKNQLTLNF
jgi:hypothetical protein